MQMAFMSKVLVHPREELIETLACVGGFNDNFPSWPGKETGPARVSGPWWRVRVEVRTVLVA